MNIEMPNAEAAPEPHLETPIPLSLIQKLLLAINVSVAPGALDKAWEQLSKELPAETQPPQRLQFLFQRLQLRGLRVAQLRWSRMDQRRLPALMFIEGQWQLAERQLAEEAENQTEEDTVGAEGVDEQHQIALTREDGLTTLNQPGDLEDGLVVWVSNPRVIDEDGLALGRSPSVRMVLSSLFKTRRWLTDISIATVVINLLAVATSLFAMQVYDRVVPTLAYATLWTLVAGMVIVTLLDWVLKTLRSRVLDSLSSEVDQEVSAKVYDHVMRLQLDTRPRSLGTLAAQVGGLESVRQFFSSGVVFTLIDMPFALMFLVFIAIIGGPVAWVYAALLPVAIALGWYGQVRLRQLTKEEMMRSNERQGLLVDSIQGTESIRTANASWRFNEQWQDISKSVAGYSIRQKALNNFVQVTTGSLSSIAYVGAIVVGVGLVGDGLITMGAMIACSILGGRVIGPIGQGVRFLSQWQNVRQALNMVDQVLELKTERQDGQTLLMPTESPKSVTLESVTFSYPESPVKQLNIPSLNLKAGERVVILGQIGSGKSTLLKVLGGMYRPSQGRIRLGYGDLWEIDPVIIARDLAYLPQSVHLFKGTLRSNLVLGGAISDSHLLEVSQQLGIDAIAADSP
ncbi:MAG: ABC transporter transmembrane domain-containing protein, partial [Oceanobacter sp.]